jgi:prolyl oligopeptidase
MRAPWSLAVLLGCSGQETHKASLSYPAAPRDEQAVDTYFGTAVVDPYRSLEDPDAPATKEWVAAQNALTASWLSEVPERERIRARLTALWNHERYTTPRKLAGKYFYEHNDGLQNQNQLFVADTLEGEPRLLLDANTFSADGTVPLAQWEVSDDGRWLVYGLSDGGSDWRTLRVREIDTGKDLADEVRWVRFSGVSFLPDSSGFFYSRYPEPAEGQEEAALAHQQVWLHKIGTAQSEDELVLEAKDEPKWGFDVEVTEDGRYLVASVWQGSEKRSRVWVKPRDAGPEVPWNKVLDAFDAMYTVIGSEGDRLWVWTDNGAPRGRLVEVDVQHPEPTAWVERIPQSDDLLKHVSAVGDRFFALYLHDAHSVVRTYSLEGAPLGEVALPGLGSASGFDGRAQDTETFFSFESYTEPSRIFRYDLGTGEASLFRETKLPFDASAYVTEQVFYPSKDGTKIPMFLVRRKDLALDGSHPTLLYGYGGFNISQTPAFTVPIAVWLEMGGVYAVANLRGGGEYGRDWHEAGTKLQKQNVFDDFVSAAEHLISTGVTRPDKLAIHGRSNGGLLVGAVMLQRPDLFGAAVPGVGVMDMLKYHTWTIGWGWASDYGTAAESEEMFRALLAYSPVHNTRPASYPPTLILTADHDDRVVPAHSFKFAASLQHAQQGPAPILARIETRAGHGAGKPVSMQVEERTDMLSFLVKALDMEPALR